MQDYTSIDRRLWDNGRQRVRPVHSAGINVSRRDFFLTDTFRENSMKTSMKLAFRCWLDYRRCSRQELFRHFCLLRRAGRSPV